MVSQCPDYQCAVHLLLERAGRYFIPIMIVSMAETLILTGGNTETLATEIERDDVLHTVRDAYRQRGDGAPANVRRDITSVDDGVLAEYGALLPESAVMGTCFLDWGFGSGDSWTAVTLF